MESTYIKQIKELILIKNDLGINEVRYLTILRGFNYDKESYFSIADMVRQNRISDIMLIPEHKEKTFEDFTLLQFNDQIDILHIVAIYDNDELWQDPIILEIFPQ